MGRKPFGNSNISAATLGLNRGLESFAGRRWLSMTLTPASIFDRVRQHDFNPLRDGFTFDRHLDKHGVASLDDQDWLVRTLSVRDLVRLGASVTPALVSELEDENEHLRQVAVMVLGILQATDSATALERILTEDCPTPKAKSGGSRTFAGSNRSC
jgi:hypothetical protein